MPKVTIWIRVEDQEKWNAIEDKPKWLHKMLTGSYTTIPDILDPRERGIDPKEVESSLPTIAEELEEEAKQWEPPDTYFIDRATGHVVDTDREDYVESDKEMVDWLKKHNRYIG